MGGNALPLNGLRRVAAPAAPLISLEDARLQCRVDAWGSPPQNPEDALLQSYVEAATGELDGADGWLNRALVTQTWQLALGGFPQRLILLPLPPLQSVVSVKYDAPDGSEQTLAADQYRVITDTEPGAIEPVVAWPATQGKAAAVRITYVAGYGDPEDVPEVVRNYVRARVGQLYDFRSLTIMRTGMGVQAVPYMRDSLESIRMRGVRP